MGSNSLRCGSSSVTAIVITSYSIHYTKLYEEKSYGDPQRNILMVDNQKALGIGLSMESGENIVEVGKRVEARLAELENRITSYNVCYTKLLRIMINLWSC